LLMSAATPETTLETALLTATSSTFTSSVLICSLLAFIIWEICKSHDVSYMQYCGWSFRTWSLLAFRNCLLSLDLFHIDRCAGNRRFSNFFLRVRDILFCLFRVSLKFKIQSLSILHFV
jgi:hypothetical protein